ncbi:MAG: YhgE/Pip family protein, partial [Microlunatus sp.]|nr:YhgE/Pip family protein [Microlunatus sp.]
MNLERTTGSRRLGWVSLLGALLVPIMLAAGFLAATWNSQSRWDKVQAAIVNQDQPVTIDGQPVPLGRQLASGLVKGDGGEDHQGGKQNFDWVITDASDAGKGLADGRYAAVVTIPKAFSKDATSYAANKGDQAEQATLGVQTSKVSGVTDAAIAQAISSTAVGSLNTQLTRQYLDNLYLGFNQTQQGFEKSAGGATGLSQGAGQIRDGIGKSADGATKLATGMGRLSNGTTKLSDGLGQTDTAVGQLATGIAGLHSGIAQTTAGVGKLDTGVGKLADGMDSYATGARAYAKGVKKYTGGVSKLTDNLGPYADGVRSYIGGVDKYVAGVNEYAAGVGDYVDGVGTAADQVASKVGAADVTQAQVDQVCTAAGFDPSSAECAGVAVGMKAGMQAGADGTAAGIKQAMVASGDPANPSAGEQLKAGAATITDSGSKITSGGTDLANGSTRISGAAGKLGKAGDQIATGAAGLASGAKKIDKGLAG